MTLTCARKFQKSCRFSPGRSPVNSSGRPFINTLTYSAIPAWKRLTCPNLSANERIDLIMTIFSDRDEAEASKYFFSNDAQTFVDTMVEASTRNILSLGVPSPTKIFVPLARPWEAWMTLHQISVGGVCARCIRPVVAKPCFQNHSKFRFVTTQRKVHCIEVGSRMCGRAIIRARWLQPRF